MRPTRTVSVALLTVTTLFCIAQGTPPSIEVDKDTRIAELTARVAELEQSLAELTDKTVLLIEQARLAELKNKARTAARARLSQDRSKYSPEVLVEVESLYQTAHDNWVSPAAVAALADLTHTYPDLNRTGCAMLKRALMETGENKVDYLTRAMTEFADCYYEDGVNVGAYARYQLAFHYWEKQQINEAWKLFEQIRADHPNAIDHQGRPLADQLDAYTTKVFGC